MSTIEDTNIPEPGGAVQEAKGDSLLQKAEKRRNERERNLFLDVPTWGGDLVCEYEVIPKAEVKAMAERQQRALRSHNNEDRINFDLDLIIRAAVGLYAIDPDTGDRVAIEDEFGHVGYDRIATKLGVEDKVKSNRDAVRYLTGEVHADGTWDDNVIAISRHAQAIARWIKDPSRQTGALEELLGEL